MARARRRFRLHPLQLIVHSGAWVPLIVLVYDYFTNHLTFNPIQAAEQRTGLIAIILLGLSLACTPVNTLLRYPPVLKVRRALGLYGYLYAAIHLLIFFVFDYTLDLGLILQAIGEKRFILIGLAAFILLSLLALTSFRWWKARLGKNWKRLHQLVYVINFLVVLHFALSVKGNIFRLQGDVGRPLAAGMILFLLLFLRLPQVRRFIAGQRRRAAPPMQKHLPLEKEA